MTGAFIQLPNKFAVAVMCCIGMYGNGNERKEAIEKMGYNYREIQNVVNELFPIIKRCE